MTYTEMPAKRTLTFVIHNIDRPARVSATSKLKQSYNKSTRTLTLTASSIALPLSITLTK
jgi:hypothetical protein